MYAPWSDSSGAAPAQISDFAALFENIVQVLIACAGIALFILLLTGGFKFITSGGDPKATEGAQKTITYAIGGLILILLSYLILVLIQQITGVKVTLFNVILPAPISKNEKCSAKKDKLFLFFNFILAIDFYLRTKSFSSRRTNSRIKPSLQSD